MSAPRASVAPQEQDHLCASQRTLEARNGDNQAAFNLDTCSFAFALGSVNSIVFRAGKGRADCSRYALDASNNTIDYFK